MFHLSIPVGRYQECLDFYQSCFSAEIVALGPTSANIFLFGAQLTLHDNPASSFVDEARKAIHFGPVVSTKAWMEIRDRIIGAGYDLVRCTTPSDAPDGRGKLIVEDPGGNLVEVNSLPSRV